MKNTSPICVIHLSCWTPFCHQ